MPDENFCGMAGLPESVTTPPSPPRSPAASEGRSLEDTKDKPKLHPNIEEELKKLECIAHSLSAMQMPFASRSIHSAIRVITDHFTRQPANEQ